MQIRPWIFHGCHRPSISVADTDKDFPLAAIRRHRLFDYLHQMLGLKNDEALCGEEHLVCKEYLKPGGSAAFRVFSKGGIDGKTIMNMQGAESALFVNALSSTQLCSSPALSTIDFI